MKILAFPFFNETAIVETKIATIGPLVDAIVVSEGMQTFSGKQHKAEFYNLIRTNPIISQYKRKIAYLQCDLSEAEPLARFGEETAARWGRDITQRNVLGEMCRNGFDDDDIVILTDADEIPDPEWVASLDGITKIEHTLMWRHCYYVNMRAPHPRLHEQVCRAFPNGMLHLMTMEEMARTQPDRIYGNADKGYGWHFTYMGGAGAIRNKLGAFAHGEYDKPPWNTFAHIEDRMRSGKDLFDRPYNDCEIVPDSVLPDYMVTQKESELFKHLWYPDGRNAVWK